MGRENGKGKRERRKGGKQDRNIVLLFCTYNTFGKKSRIVTNFIMIWTHVTTLWTGIGKGVVYPLSPSTCHPVSATTLIQVARPGYLYPATCIWCKRGFSRWRRRSWRGADCGDRGWQPHVIACWDRVRYVDKWPSIAWHWLLYGFPSHHASARCIPNSQLLTNSDSDCQFRTFPCQTAANCSLFCHFSNIKRFGFMHVYFLIKLEYAISVQFG